MNLDFLSSHVVSGDIFPGLVNWWQGFKNNGFQGADPGIVMPCKVINQLPGVVSIFSCEGHLESEASKVLETPYFILAAGTPDAVVLIMRLFNNTRQIMAARGFDKLNCLSLGFTTRIQPDLSTHAWYPALIVSLNYRTRESFDRVRLLFLSALEEAAKDLVVEFYQAQGNEASRDYQNTWVKEDIVFE